MEKEGLKRTRFLPQLAIEKEQTLGWLQEGRLKTPTLVVWSYSDPAASIRRGQALFDLVAGSTTPRTEMHIFTRSGHFCYREHPQEFNELIRGFVQSL